MDFLGILFFFCFFFFFSFSPHIFPFSPPLPQKTLASASNMGNSPSSASSDSEHDFAVPTDEQAAKKNKRLQRKQEKALIDKLQFTKKPELHPTAAKVVRPHDSQVVYNHGRVGIHGIGHEHQNFPCICKEIAEVQGIDQTKLLALIQQQQLQSQSQEPNLNKPNSTKSTNNNNNNNTNTPPALTGITADGKQIIVTPSTTPTTNPASNPEKPFSPPLLALTPSQNANPNDVTFQRSVNNGRCTTCGGIVEDFNELTIPSCSWIDGTIPLGSLITSMVAAQRNFSESLKQVQSEDQPLIMLSNMTGFDMPTVRALQMVFSKISDHDGKDNLISAQELCIATGIPPDSILGKAMFRLMDITRSNNINFRTWIMMLAKLSPHASLEDKISFAFTLYDDNGDGFIDRQDLIAMLCSVIPDLHEQDALTLIESIFDLADADGDRRIDYDDYKQLVSNSHAFYEAFTIDIATVLRQHYGVISDDLIAHRVSKLQERDLRQEERAAQVNEKETQFMEREHEEVRIVENLDELDL
jgi:serine/threonine-protein phosphatase 2B regulatory subunit